MDLQHQWKAKEVATTIAKLKNMKSVRKEMKEKEGYDGGRNGNNKLTQLVLSK